MTPVKRRMVYDTTLNRFIYGSTLQVQIVSSRFKTGHSPLVVILPAGSRDGIFMIPQRLKLPK